MIPITLIWTLILISIATAKEPKKIIGGEPVDSIDQFPYQVSVRHVNDHICGGVIITNYHILGSASCVVIVLDTERIVLTNLKILSGTISSTGESTDGEIHDVAWVFYHENYKPQEFWKNDIAIFRLEKPLILSYTRKQVEMPYRQYLKKNLWVTGWGLIPDSTGKDIVNPHLQKLNCREITQDRCNDIYSEFAPLYETQACAEAMEFTALITPGDGGGPVTSCRRLIGIISIKSVNIADPFIFTLVYPYIDWIKKITEDY